MKKFLQDFIKERGYLHYFTGSAVAFLFSKIILIHMHIEQTPTWFECAVNFGLLWIIGFLWEHYWARKKKAPFSYSDINWSALGGATGYLLTLL